MRLQHLLSRRLFHEHCVLMQDRFVRSCNAHSQLHRFPAGSHQRHGIDAASGLLRMDRCSLGDKHKDTDNAGWALNVHSCHTANTTAYVRYPGEAILANDPNADIAGFICSPLGFGVEAVVITHARTGGRISYADCR